MTFDIPEHMAEGFRLYIEHGVPMGGFGTALLENDLRGAVQSADHINRNLLREFVDYLFWEMPAPAWGSPERVAAWIRAGGTAGIRATRMRATGASE